MSNLDTLDTIEFYEETGNILAHADSAMVPPVDSFINIRGKTWKVQAVTYALDYSSEPHRRRMRANVDLIALPVKKAVKK